MADCDKLEACAFFKTYETEPGRELALKGFISTYCKGEKQAECVRKIISQKLGGADKVPVNMMPNGMALSGTGKDDWSKEVLEIIN